MTFKLSAQLEAWFGFGAAFVYLSSENQFVYQLGNQLSDNSGRLLHDYEI